MSEIAIIALGSNLDDPAKQLNRAFDSLGQLPSSKLVRRSSVFQSKPLGPQDQDVYCNAAATLETDLDAVSLLSELQAIETSFGRIKTRHWGERVIDLDIIFFGQHIIQSRVPDLSVPHPQALKRDFVCEPILEIEPLWILPDGSYLKDQRNYSESFLLKKCLPDEHL